MLKNNEKIFSHVPREIVPINNLSDVQLNSYKWFLEKGLREIFDEASPIKDYSEKDLELFFKDYRFDEPKYDEFTAKRLGLSFETPLRVSASLLNKRTGEIKEQSIFFGDFPLMTSRGTFVVNGVERVVISQLIRSSGIYFTSRFYRSKNLFGAKLIPNRGAWLEFDTEPSGVISVKIDRKRKLPVTALLRSFGYESDSQIKNLFKGVDQNPNLSYIAQTLAKDPTKNQEQGLIEVYKRMKPGDLATADNAKQLVESAFFNFDRYDLATVGRYKLDLRLGRIKIGQEKLPVYKKKDRVFKAEDLIDIIKEIIKLNNDPQAKADDMDHLGNRRVRSVGELLQSRIRIGLVRMERIIRDRMSISDIYSLTPAQLINARPFIAAVKEFFVSSQLSQFMDQHNPLAELEHKRRLSAMGPGGLTRERAGYEVRDVHTSHYGRICPIQTPEGANIGLIGHLALYSRINEFGFIETPYQVVEKGRVTNKIIYLNALEEEKFNIAHAAVRRSSHGEILDKMVPARINGNAGTIERSRIHLIDVSTKQPFSVATSLIPFLAHDDANRALMGANMQKQAVISIKPERPFVGTGIERKAALDSGKLVIAKEDGQVVEVDANRIVIKPIDKKNFKEYQIHTFKRSNQDMSITQKVLVKKGDKVKQGDVIADGPSSEDGFLALGHNLLVAFMPWKGSNYEDAIILSEKVLKKDVFSSIHIEEFSVDVRDTKLGPEITTPDIPNIGEEKLKDLNEDGIIRIGAEVGPNSILVGKITPKGETDLTAEERLLMAIFGDKARDVKDTSKRMSHGKFGRIVGIKIFSRDEGDKLPTGVIKSIHIEVAEYRKVAVGDKLAGRHGNKGVISAILPEEDMPYLPDGRTVDIILNPLGVASRMNLGQILETHLGWSAAEKGYYAIVPPFSGMSEEEIKLELKSASLPEDGKITLCDGYSGEPFVDRITVGYIYMMKLKHLVEDKIHMRSTGPYSLITQQPLGGKAQFGGQRFGEMEVWALEGYGAAHTLQEMLTIKSDDVVGRSAAIDSIIRGEKIKNPNIPASFHVLVNELRGLGLVVDLIEGDERR